VKRPFTQYRPIGPFAQPTSGKITEGKEYIIVGETTGVKEAIADAYTNVIVGTDEVKFEPVGSVEGNRELTENVINGVIVEATKVTKHIKTSNVRSRFLEQMDRIVKGEVIGATVCEYQ